MLNLIKCPEQTEIFTLKQFTYNYISTIIKLIGTLKSDTFTTLPEHLLPYIC